MYASSLFQSLFLQSLLFFIHSHSFNQITSIVYDLDGDLLFADKYSNCVRRYYLTTNTHDEFAGRCGSYGNRDGKQKKRSASQWQNKTDTINNCWNKKFNYDVVLMICFDCQTWQTVYHDDLHYNQCSSSNWISCIFRKISLF